MRNAYSWSVVGIVMGLLVHYAGITRTSMEVTRPFTTDGALRISGYPSSTGSQQENTAEESQSKEPPGADSDARITP